MRLNVLEVIPKYPLIDEAMVHFTATTKPLVRGPQDKIHLGFMPDNQTKSSTSVDVSSTNIHF